MAVEAIRGCGYRKVGGLYLCGRGLSMVCDRLPYELAVCPVCGSGVKFSRGFTWIDWLRYAGEHKQEGSVCSCLPFCPVCHPASHSRLYGLLWVGEAFYTPESFVQEAIQMGVSKRIAVIPKNLKLGETWVLFAHKKAVTKVSTYPAENPNLPSTVESPGIFYAFRPHQLELLIWQKDATYEKHDELVKRGITPIIIPDGDVDHDPRTSLVPKDEEKNKLFFDGLRTMLAGGK